MLSARAKRLQRVAYPGQADFTGPLAALATEILSVLGTQCLGKALRVHVGFEGDVAVVAVIEQGLELDRPLAYALAHEDDFCGTVGQDDGILDVDVDNVVLDELVSIREDRD